MFIFRELAIDGTSTYTSDAIALNGHKIDFELSLFPKASLDGTPTVTLQVTPIKNPSGDSDWIDLDVVTAKAVDLTQFQMWYGSQLPGCKARIQYAPGGATVGTIDLYFNTKK